MQPNPHRRGLAAAVLTGALWLAPAAQAGVFSTSALLDLTLTSALPADVTLTYANAITFEDDLASNPPRSFYTADVIITDEPTLGTYGTVMTVTGDALSIDDTPAEVAAQRQTEGSLEITNDSADAVALDFDYAFSIIAEVFAQATGRSVANAFARVELIQDGDFIAELVAAALDGRTSHPLSGGGSFTLEVPAGATATLSFIVDAGGDATHVPVPSALALLAVGLGVLGVRRRGGLSAVRGTLRVTR